MIDNLISTISTKLGIDESIARQAISMVMQALNSGGEGSLVTELSERIPGLGDLAGPEGGSGRRGLMGVAAGLLGGGGDSPLRGLSTLLGEEKMAGVNDAIGEAVAEETDADLGNRLRDALARIS